MDYLDYVYYLEMNEPTMRLEEFYLADWEKDPDDNLEDEELEFENDGD